MHTHTQQTHTHTEKKKSNLRGWERGEGQREWERGSWKGLERLRKTALVDVDVVVVVVVVVLKLKKSINAQCINTHNKHTHT